jgi:putative membrane protein
MVRFLCDIVYNIHVSFKSEIQIDRGGTFRYMKNIWQVFTTDIRKIFAKPFAVVVLVGIMIIPSLYAWFNIYANWDPYSNTKGLKVAVANTDQGASIEGLNVNVGGMIIDKLAQNDKIGWVFTNADQAIDGTESGEYYAAVIIPADFSSKILSITQMNIQRPEIEYYVNEKKNAIAPKITNSGITTVQQQVNETFIATVTDVISNTLINVNSKVENSQDALVGGVITDLKDLRSQLVEYKTLIQSVQDASLAVNSALGASRSLLPVTQNALSQASTVGTDAQNMIDSSKTVTAQLSDSISQINSLVSSSLDTADSALQQAFTLLQKDSSAAADKIDEVKKQVDSSIDLSTRARDALQSIQDKLPQQSQVLQNMIDKLNAVIQKETDLSSTLGNAAKTIRSTGTLPESVRQDLSQKMKDARASAADIVTVYNQTTGPALDTLFTDMYGSLGSLSTLLTTIGSTTPTVDTALGGMSDSINYSVSALNSTSGLIDSAIGKIDGFINEIESATSGEQLQKLVDLISRDPDLVASFMSAPVEVNTTSLYPISNYGSAMTPFYTILCLWVGALINCAIMKVHIKDDDGIEDLTPNQGYFGRYLLFMFTGIMQALIVTLGDLYILKIQCLQPLLFVLAGALVSIVFTNQVYTLVVSFGNVGKAIAVVLLVIQVAGAGGTFPIETLPQFYQNLYPWFPFTYGINAMRECVAGIYQNHYIVDLLKLMCFIPGSLLLGLVLRKPIIRMNHYLETKLEETDIIG